VEKANFILRRMNNGEKDTEGKAHVSVEVQEEKDNRQYHKSVGRRKTAVANLKLFPKGEGKFVVNGKEMKVYFAEPGFADIVLAPFNMLNNQKDFDIKVIVKGGGKHAQAEAARHAIARALVDFDQELRTTLKKSGYLSRDSRAKERKKYGLKRARKAPQFSKR
jgi:small subunit ribosomal protein S9